MIRLLASMCTFVTVVAVSVSADVIGWNFTSNWGSPTIQGDGFADGFDQWTDSVDEANSPGGTEVPNSADAWSVTTPINAPMVTVAWTSANMWQAGDETNPDQGLYRVYLDDGGAGPIITVSGLSDWLASTGDSAYEIRLYRNSDNSPTFNALSIYDGAATTDPLLETIPVMAAVGDGSYPTGTGGGGNRLLQDAAGTFTADTVTFNSVRDGGVRGSIAGFKITSIPEPTTLGLMAAAGGLLLLRRRRAI